MSFRRAILFAGSLALALSGPVSAQTKPKSAFGWSADPNQNAAVDPAIPVQDGAAARSYLPALRGVMSGVAQALGTAGQANGIATLGSDGKLPLNQFPTGAISGLAPLASPTFTGTATVPTLAISGSGSTGSVSDMTVTPDAFALENTLARILGRTGGISPNIWYNPDGALGDGSPKVVFNDGLSIYGPRRWIFQQVTLTPYVTGQRVQAADGSNVVRMLNGYAASGSLPIGTGTKSFTVASGLNFAPGFPVKAVVANDLTKSMSGTVASYSGTTVVLNVTSTTGSGTFTDWTIGASGTTKQGQTKLTTTAASPARSTTLSFSDTTGVQIGANVEFAFDASFNSLNGIQRGTYVVSKTATTVTISQPTVSPAGATGGAAVVSGQLVTFYGNQGNYLFQDMQVADAVGFKYGTPDARDAYLSFNVVSSGLPNCTASMMMLGYKSISELGRSYVQSFPVTGTKTRVTVKINGDKVGAPGTWRAGYGANTWGGLWGTIGFVWESQGTATAQNIPDGQWSNAFAVGGSDQQTCDLTGTVGASVDVSDVNLTLDKPLPFVPPTEQSYPSPEYRARKVSLPQFVLEASNNPANLKSWHWYLKGDGSTGFGRLDEAGNETPAVLYNADGTVVFPSYPAGTLSVDASGKLGSTPGAFINYTPAFGTTVGTATFTNVGGKYRVDGRTMFFKAWATVSNNGTGAGLVTASAPTSCTNDEWSASGFDTGPSGKPIFGRGVANSATMQIKQADLGYPATTGSVLSVSGWCEIP